MSIKLFEAFSYFDKITGLLVENLDQKIAKILQNNRIKEFISNKRSNDVDRSQMTDEIYVRRIANIFDPTPDKKFLEYIIKNWMEGNINGDEDAPQVKSALTKYVSLTARNTPNLNKDINFYRNINDLYKTITQLSPATPTETYKERIEAFLKAAKESNQSVEKILDLPEGYHLYMVKTGPKTDSNIFNKSDICQGYWCIKQPHMAHYYPLYFLEKNGFIDLAIVPKANEIKNPYNKAEYTDAQEKILEYLFNNWKEINEKTGNKFFDPNKLHGDFSNFIISLRIKSSVNLDKIKQEISEAMDKYNTVATVPKIPSIEILNLPGNDTRTMFYVNAQEEAIQNVGFNILKYIKSLYNNLSLKDKLKYHFFFINIVTYVHVYFGTLRSQSGGQWLNAEDTSLNSSFVYEPFLPPNSINSLKQLSELYYNNFNLFKINKIPLFTRKSEHSSILEFLKGEMTVMFKYMIVCNALLKAKGADVFVFTDNEKGSKIINYLDTLTRTDEDVIVIFAGRTSYQYVDLISRDEFSSAFIKRFNNLDNTIQKTNYFTDESIEKDIKNINSKLNLKSPNKDIIDSKNGDFNKIYIIPELEAIANPYLARTQQGGSLPFYARSNEENYRDVVKIIKQDEDLPTPKVFRSVVKGGFSEIEEAYKKSNTIDVNNLLAINYLINLDLHPRTTDHHIFTQTKQGVEYAKKVKITGNIMPDLGNKVYSRFFNTLDKAKNIEPRDDLRNILLTPPNYDFIKSTFYNPQDPSSILIGRFSAGLLTTSDVNKRESNIFRHRLLNARENRKFTYATSIDPDQIIYTYTLFKKLYDQYSDSFYPSNQSSLSRCVYTLYNILIIPSRKATYTIEGDSFRETINVDFSELDIEFLWKLFLESFFNLKGEELFTFLNNAGIIQGFHSNSFINNKLKKDEALQQKIYNFIKNENTELLKSFYINKGGKVIKAPDSIESGLGLMGIARYRKGVSQESKKVTFKDIKEKNPAARYIIQIGKYTLGKDFREGVMFDQTWSDIGIQVLSGPTNDNLTVIKNGTKDLKWLKIYKFFNKTSYGASYIITGTVKDQETGEELPILYYRKETTPGAGQSLIYLPEHFYTVYGVKDLIINNKEIVCKNGELVKA